MKTLMLALSLTLALPAVAARMDDSTQELVIVRLERALENMTPKSRSWGPTHLRLADLLAERARQRFQQEIEAGCKDCKGSTADRRKAMSLYEQVMKSEISADNGAIILQLAHLNSMAGDTEAARKLFVRVVEGKAGQVSKAHTLQARTALADIEFQKGNSKAALKHYEAALKEKSLENRPLVVYRVAWCRFHTGDLTGARDTLEQLLKSKESLAVETDKGSMDDPSLRADALRDLATFYSRRPVGDAEIKRYLAFAPKGQRKEFLLHFAGEVDRIGQKAAADKLLELYLNEPGLTPKERLNAFIRRAQIQYDMGQSAKSTDVFAVAALNLKETGCDDPADCEELRKRMKRYVTELHRSQKTKLTVDVLKAYFIYSKTFPEDTETALRGAQVAIDLKNYPMAISLARDAGVTAAKQGNATLTATAVWTEIEAAELSKDSAARESAYKQALALIPNDPKAFFVRYQLAQIAYERKQWSTAAQAFKALALDASGSAELRKKSADLALDALAVEKRDAEIETWSREFAVALPSAGAEYATLSRKALNNQVAGSLDAQDASRSDLKIALRKLQTDDLRGASTGEKVIHFKNRALAAQKLGDDAEMKVALAGLLAIPALSAKDREDTLARLVGVHESRLEFAEAYAVATKMKFPGLSTAEKQRRLGTLADLAGRNPRPHYEAALKAGLIGQAAIALRSRLIQIAADPAKELNKHRKALASSPRTYGETVLAIYGRTRNAKPLETHFKALASTPVPAFIRKQPYYLEHQTLSRRIAKHNLDARRDSVLQKTIKARMAMLREADRSLEKALSLKDFTAQVLALGTVARENDRFVKDLLDLPAPAALNDREKREYAALLKQTSSPYARKAKVAQTKLNEFWNRSNTINALVRDLDNARTEVRPLLRDEIRLLAQVAPSITLRWKLDSAAKETEPGRAELQIARENVRRSPRDAGQIEKLKNLETKIGHPLMSSYLEGRLNQIQREEI